MMASDIESRAIRLEKIGQLDEGDLRDTYLYLGKDVVEAVLIPEGQDFAVVIFTDKKCKSLNNVVLSGCIYYLIILKNV